MAPETKCPLEQAASNAINELAGFGIRHDLMLKLLNLIDGYVIVKGADDRIIFCNRYAAERAGASQEEMVGRVCWDFWPDSRAEQWRNTTAVIASGVPTKDLIYAIKGPSGTTRHKVCQHPLHDDDGTLYGVMIMAVPLE